MAFANDIQGWLISRLAKLVVSEKRVDLLKPQPWCLFETVKSLLQSALKGIRVFVDLVLTT